jgi:membrane protease YdiL (CAAX protease family)
MVEENKKLISMKEHNLFEFLIVTTCIAIIPGVCEEFFFRGYLMQNIQIKNGKKKAVLYSAIIFTIIHLNPISFLHIFIMGIFLGYLLYYSGSLIPAIIFHFLNNFTVVIVVNFYPEVSLYESNYGL